MAVHYRTQALVLKKRDRGEADQVIAFYTKEYGKLQILGRAIRKIKSKLKSATELFYLAEIEFIQGKTFKTLTDAREIESFKGLRGDFEKMRAAFKILETLDRLVRGEEADKSLWRLLIESFKRLDSSSFSGFIIYHYFAWNLLSVLGYQLDFDNCFLCGNKLNHSLFFNPGGGFACSQCRKGKRISTEAFKIIRLLSEKNWEGLKKAEISDGIKKEVSFLTEDFISSL